MLSVVWQGAKLSLGYQSIIALSKKCEELCVCFITKHKYNFDAVILMLMGTIRLRQGVTIQWVSQWRTQTFELRLTWHVYIKNIIRYCMSIHFKHRLPCTHCLVWVQPQLEYIWSVALWCTVIYIAWNRNMKIKWQYSCLTSFDRRRWVSICGYM